MKPLHISERIKPSYHESSSGNVNLLTYTELKITGGHRPISVQIITWRGQTGTWLAILSERVLRTVGAIKKFPYNDRSNVQRSYYEYVINSHIKSTL